MPVGIRIFTEAQTSQHKIQGELVFTFYDANMAAALKGAALHCVHWELACSDHKTAPDKTLYAYDCLGGLRFEARRRNGITTIKRT